MLGFYTVLLAIPEERPLYESWPKKAVVDVVGVSKFEMRDVWLIHPISRGGQSRK